MDWCYSDRRRLNLRLAPVRATCSVQDKFFCRARVPAMQCIMQGIFTHIMILRGIPEEVKYMGLVTAPIKFLLPALGSCTGQVVNLF